MIEPLVFLTSCDEKTAGIAKDQIIKLGFYIVHLDKKEEWFDKYQRFIRLASNAPYDYFIRVDADVILNKNIKTAYQNFLASGALFGQANTFSFYANDLVDSVCFYSMESIKIISDNITKLDPDRPETSASRLPEINHKKISLPETVGMNSFFQNNAHFTRHLNHKKDRKQMSHYDFDLATKLLNL